MGGVSTKLRYKFSVIAADASITLGGRTYNNVYQTNMKPEVSTGTTFSETGETWLFYYAKGVGLIYAKNTMGSTTVEEYRLRNWQLF